MPDGKMKVALLAEGVDRNIELRFSNSTVLVALLAEGVDRNNASTQEEWTVPWSPSSRRAWIEMRWQRLLFYHLPVALLAEGVDRNTSCAFW